MKSLFTFLLVISFSFSASALDLEKIMKLDGSWKFNVGDNLVWAEKNFNDAQWDKMTVPGHWEDDGYVGLNGFAWYRTSFSFTKTDSYKNYYLTIQSIDDADEVYLNGKQIGFLGSFPPNYETAWPYKRIYVIPAHLLEENNVLAVRVYDLNRNGGINGEVFLCVDEDEELVDFDLSGNWKFKTGHNKERKQPGFNDSDWQDIYVPQPWEMQGYKNYDGYAWYRKTFTLPNNLSDEDLVLVLGKIDDVDMVYLNGKLIGTSMKENDKYNRYDDGNAWATNRAYKIPEGLMKEKNVIAIAVYDMGKHGGIYVGPIGIMTKNNYYESKVYREPKSNEGFWEYILKELFD